MQRFRIRFSLRFLLMVVVVVAGLVLWGKFEAARAVANRDAVRAVWSLDGTLQYEWMISGVQSKFPDFLRDWIGDEYLSTVRSIQLEGPKVTDESVRSFIECHKNSLQKVTEITFRNCSITGKTLHHLIALPNIAVLRVEGTDLADEDLSLLLGFRQLRVLTLANPPLTTSSVAFDRDVLSLNGLRRVSAHPALESLSLHGFVLNDGNIKCLRDFELGSLHIINHSSAFCEVSDEGLKHLEGMKCINHLDLAGADITDASMPVLATLVNIRSLSLMLTSITSDGLCDIDSLKMLRSLTVDSPYLTDDCLRHFKNMPNLVTLSLPGRPTLSPELQAIRDEVLKEIGDETMLAQFGITAKAALEFKKFHSPKLTFRLH